MPHEQVFSKEAWLAAEVQPEQALVPTRFLRQTVLRRPFELVSRPLIADVRRLRKSKLPAHTRLLLLRIHEQLADQAAAMARLEAALAEPAHVSLLPGPAGG